MRGVAGESGAAWYMNVGSYTQVISVALVSERTMVTMCEALTVPVAVGF